MATGTDLRQGLTKLSQLSQETTLPSYDEIELDEIEIEAALRKAREEKSFKIAREAYKKRLTESPHWFVPTATDFKNVLLTTVSKNGNPFEVTEFNREVIDQLCLYFANDPNFKGDPKKGIMLMGNPGVGKTHLMNFFAKNPKASYIIPTCKIITERYANKWSHEEKSTIEYYSELKRADVGHQWDQLELGACFGDLGSETGEASSYGNKKNVMEEIIFNRYEANLPCYMTHFTTNLNSEELGQKYGQRFRDRLREMCNVFTIKGDSFRK
jgi:hypothetical protein